MSSKTKMAIMIGDADGSDFIHNPFITELNSNSFTFIQNRLITELKANLLHYKDSSEIIEFIERIKSYQTLVQLISDDLLYAEELPIYNTL